MKSKNPLALLGAWLGLTAGAGDVARAQTAVAPAPAAADEVVELSPFVTRPDKGWVGSSSLIGNRTNMEIKDIPLSVDAITADFMQDVGAHTLEDAAKFVAGMTTTELVQGGADRARDEGRVTYRGLEHSSATSGGSTAQSSRNFFLWYTPTDNYNIERIDFNKGSNSLMFGDASPGGQAATYTKRALFRNFGQVSAKYGSFGSYRATFDLNRKLHDKVAARFNYVARNEGSYLKGIDAKLVASHLALTFQPFKNTQIRAEGEYGRFNRTRADNQVRVRQNSAPGAGFNTAAVWYYTSDGTIVNRTTYLTAQYPNPSAGDQANGSGLFL